MKKKGVLVENFEMSTKEVPTSSFVGGLENISPPRGTNSYITHLFPVTYIFQLITLKGTAKSSAMDLLRLPKRYQNLLF